MLTSSRTALVAVPLLAFAGLALHAQDREPAEGREAPPSAPRAFLGVQVQSPRPGAAQEGVVVESADPGSPAAQAGLRPGDQIVRAGDKDVRDFEDLVLTLTEHRPGDRVPFQVVRGGQRVELNVTLAERPRRRTG